MNEQSFTPEEIIPFLGLAIIVAILFTTYYLRGHKEFWSPLVIIAVVFAYYCLLGPYNAVAEGRTTDRLIQMRPYYAVALWGALVSLASCTLGFFLHGQSFTIRPNPMTFDDEWLSYYGKRLYIVGFVLFTISTKGNVLNLINPLDAEGGQEGGGSFFNYFLLSVNFLAPAVALLFIYFLRTRKGLLWFLITFAITAGLYTTLGFRYRLVILIGGLAGIYYHSLDRRPNLILMAILVYGFITVMGIINIGRQYGKGLDVSKIENKTSEEYYKSGLNESRIFQTSGAIIAMVPEKMNYIGFQPFISTLLFPIPSKIYTSKNSAGYIIDALTLVYGPKLFKGGAFMFYAEYYLAFGWLGIVGGSFLIGWFFRKLWNWYIVNQQNPFIVVTYMFTVVYLYVIMSRGYLPQVTMLYFFSAFPAYFIYRLAKKRSEKEYFSTIETSVDEDHSYRQ